MFNSTHPISFGLPVLALLLSFQLLIACATTEDSNTDTVLSPSEQTIEEAQIALEAAPEEATLHYALGNAYFDASRIREASESYNEAIRLDPAMASAYTNAGLCARLLGDVPRAIRYYRESLQIEPDDEITLRDMIVALEMSGDDAGQIPYLEILSEMHPEDVGLRAQLGRAHMADGSYVEAIRNLRSAQAGDPGNPLYDILVGWAYFGMKDWQNAAREWEEVIARNPNLGQAHAGLAGAYLHLQRYGDAWSSVRECQRLSVPLSPEFITQLQDASGQLGPE